MTRKPGPYLKPHLTRRGFLVVRRPRAHWSQAKGGGEVDRAQGRVRGVSAGILVGTMVLLQNALEWYIMVSVDRNLRNAARGAADGAGK